MFETTRRQLGTIKGQRVRVKDARQNDPNHIMEFTFQVPLDADLAEEILPAMRADLFDADGHPKANMTAVDYVVPGMTTQKLVVKDHPDLPEDVAVFNAVTIRDVQAMKADDGKAWVLQFTAGWILGADDQEMALIRRIKKGSIYMTLTPEQGTLLADAAEEPATAAAETPKKRGRKAKNKKQTPEAESVAQQVEGATRAEDEPVTEQASDNVVEGTFGTGDAGSLTHYNDIQRAKKRQ